MQFTKNNQKQWELSIDEDVFTFNLIPSSVTNKFKIITDFIERVSATCGSDFNDWLKVLLRESSNEEKRSIALINSIGQLKEFINAYLESTDVDYDSFVDQSKAKKNSILFQGHEIEMILKLASYLKIYALFSNSENYNVAPHIHREIYNKLAEDISNTEIVSKIFNVVKTKTFRYNLTDRFMWEYIKTIQCKDIGIHVVEIFNFIMNNILILCEEDKNPITYFVGVVDESVKWFLRSVYKGTIVYDDSISTEDIHGSDRDNLKTYSYNDTLGRLKTIAYHKIYDQLERQNLSVTDDDQYIIDFNNRLATIEFISPLCTSLVFPFFSQITRIPYIHYKTISPEHSAVLSYYLQSVLQKVFGPEYRHVFNLLEYYPLSSPSLSTTYKIKAIHQYLDIQNDTKNFYGFNTKDMPHRILCHFVGRVSRINFCNLLTGDKLSGIPLSRIESDMINFYTLYFADKLHEKVEQVKALVYADF